MMKSISFVGHSVLVMAGGTGGHVIPALTVAKELQARGAEIEWLGTRRGIESRLVPEAGIKIHYLDIEGVRGRGKLALLKAPFLLLKAISQAARVIRGSQPNVVLGLGGFASGPGGVAARIAGVPLVIHEQNAVAGTTNRLLSFIATRILESFPQSLKGAELSGNPIRQEISGLWQDSERISRRLAKASSKRILVLGGSLGAKAINELLPAAVAKIPTEQRPQLWHQTGKNHLQSTRDLYQQATVAARVDDFIADMAEAYAWADFVICRAGALTVSELTAAGIGSLLIPYPHAIDDHQTKNGLWLVEAGAALMVPQRQLDEEKLLEILQSDSCAESELELMAGNARKLARPEATGRIADVCMEACRG